MVVSALAIWKIKTLLELPVSVRTPVRPSEEVDF
jgi:hypothetical protein